MQTTANIDFGAVIYSKTVGAEIGKKSYPLVVSCGQSSDYVSANINLQLRALSGVYNGQKTRLALTQGGGISLVKSPPRAYRHGQWGM